MKDFENIEDWYKEQLSNYNVEPDKEVWKSLSNELDANTPLTEENIGEWYKKEVTKLEERPDYTVWEKLATKLDTATVWDKLVISLNRYDQFILWRNLVFRGSAVFLLLFGSYLAYNNYLSENNPLSQNTNIAGTVNAVHNISNALNPGDVNTVNGITDNLYVEEDFKGDQMYSITDLENNNNPIIKSSYRKEIRETVNGAKKTLVNKPKDNSNINNTTYASINTNEVFFKSISSNDLSNLNKENERTIFTEIDRHKFTEQDISHLYASRDFLVKKEKNKIIFNSKRFSSYFMFGLYARRFYFGINAGFKKQGIITMVNKSSELARYNKTDYLDFGSSFGATAGYIISDNFNLETNINFNSTSGYKRSYSLEGLSYKENLSLSYSTISVLAKKMNTKSTFDNKVYSTNLIAGMYLGYLRSSYSEVDGASRKLDEYNNTDFGLVLGIEQDRYLSKSWVITPGVRYNQGLMNIANDNSSFDSSRNFSLEFNLGIKYIFLKKSK